MDIEQTPTKENKRNKSQSKSKSKAKKTTSTNQFKTNMDTFKQPKSATKLVQEGRDARMNRTNQMRKNKINEYILKKRGIVDSDASEINSSSSSKILSKSMSLSNLTQLIDNTHYITPPKLCVLVSLNKDADLDSVMNICENIIKENSKTNNSEIFNSFYKLDNLMWTATVPPIIYKGKERICLIKTANDVYSILDICKVADMIMFVSSCKTTEYTKWKTDPDKYSHAIDENGYKILSMLRAQGMPEHVCILQDLNFIPDKYKSEVKKLYSRYFESELQPNKIFTLSTKTEEDINKDEYKAVIRLMCSFSTTQGSLALRKHRSYMLCENVSFIENSENKSTSLINNSNKTVDLQLAGYIRGNTILPGNFIHISGFGDYMVSDVTIEHDPCPVNSSMFSKKNSNAMDIEVLKTKGEKDDEHVENYQGIISNENKPKTIGKMQESKQKKISVQDDDIDLDLNFNLKDDNDDLSFDEEDLFDEEDGKISNKHIQKTKLKYRTDDEMEFPDEVDTPIDIPARERFEKYRGLESMKTNSWDCLENLPKEYGHIYSFENLRHLYKLAVKKAHEEGMKISGNYVKITIKGFSQEDLIYVRKDIPLVVSTLLEYERKLCVMHYKISLNYEYNNKASSKEFFEIQCGFRRILANPIFSTDVSHDKMKYEKSLQKDKFYTASLYCQMMYPNTPVILFKPDISGGIYPGEMVALGHTIDTDANKIILKKIILTGYPIKIKKKRSVIRYMFFNPSDVNYFKPIQLSTKHGLRGHITESLGTHGHMKCIFNDHLKASDTVCLNLYKRLFPKFLKESWKYKIFYGNRPDYPNYFFVKKEEEEIVNADEIMNID